MVLCMCAVKDLLLSFSVFKNWLCLDFVLRYLCVRSTKICGFVFYIYYHLRMYSYKNIIIYELNNDYTCSYDDEVMHEY